MGLPSQAQASKYTQQAQVAHMCNNSSFSTSVWCNSIVAFCQIVHSKLLRSAYLHPPYLQSPCGHYYNISVISLLNLSGSCIILWDVQHLCFQNLIKYLLSQHSNDKQWLFYSDIIIIVNKNDSKVAAERESFIDDLIQHLKEKSLDLQREDSFEDYLGLCFTSMSNGSIHMTQSGLIKKIMSTIKVTSPTITQ